MKAEVSPSVNAVPETSLRYFVYVSDTKLNNLFDQISLKLRQRLSGVADPVRDRVVEGLDGPRHELGGRLSGAAACVHRARE